MDLLNVDARDEYYPHVHNMKPTWWMKWGILLFCSIILILFFLAYSIKYPDVITSEIKMSTNNPSVSLPLPQGLQVEKVFVSNNEKTKINGNILVLKSAANYMDILSLDEDLQQFAFEKEHIIRFFEKYLNKELQLGNVVENDWISFSSDLLAFYKIEKIKTYQAQIELLDNELRKQYNVRSHYEKLVALDLKHQQLVSQQAEVDSILYQQNVTSKTDFLSSKQAYYTKTTTLEQNRLGLSRVSLEIERLRNSIESYNNNKLEQQLTIQLNLRKSFGKLKSSIQTWKQTHMLVSPIEGKVSYLQNLEHGKFYDGIVITIIPTDTNYYGLINIPIVGAGKVEVGQRVIIKINDYPYREYGVIDGYLNELYTQPNDKTYVGKVTLLKSNLSSFNKKIKLKGNMIGVAEIVTNDRTILERLFQTIIYAVKKK